MKNKLSIIIPIFNEKNLLEKFFCDLFQVFENQFVEFIVINDGSFDGSETWLTQNIEPLCDKKIKKIYLDNNKFKIDLSDKNKENNYSNIVLINHKENQGKGASVISGLKKSEGQFLTILDADHEYDPRDSLSMYNLLQEGKMGEVIFGTRFKSGLPHRHRYFLNTIINYFNTFLFNILFDRVISDIHCGQKIITRNVYENINLTSNDFSIDMDLGTQIAKSNFNISEVGVRYYSRTYKEGKKITWIDGILSYWYLFKFRFIKNNFKKNLMIYLSIITGCLVGAHFGQGAGNILSIFCGAVFGSIYGTRYSFAGLLTLIIFLLIGSQFGKGSGKILSVFVSLIIGIFLSKKSDKLIENLQINN